MTRLTEINAAIDTLSKERVEILNKDLSEECIKSLEWTKDFRGQFEISRFSKGGRFSKGDRYKIYVYGNNIPRTHLPILIMGKSYGHNLSFTNKDAEAAYFYTDSSEMLIEFISKVKFIALSYNENYLNILETIKKYGS